MLSNIVALTAGFAATASAFSCEGNYFSFFNRGGDAMSYQRLDPALFPGTESPHLHSFDGGNNLGLSTSFADTQSSSCTTARIKTDKSLYWRPTLFFNNGTGFTRVPEKSTKIYYRFGDRDSWGNVTAFPENFNMITGDPMKRSDGPNPGGIRWGCHQPNGNGAAIFSNGFPKGFTSCDYGFASEVTFPTCWNGEKLNPKNPSAHMAYPNANNGVGIENCPTTHRVARFPTLFIEFWYDIAQFNGQYGPDDIPWVVSNGDPTGYGFHADFLNGWEKGVLEKATAENGGCNCGCACGQKEMSECFGEENVNDDSDAAWASCSASMSVSGNDAAPFVEKLPGCNPLQAGPERAIMASGPDCAADAVLVADKETVSSAAAVESAASYAVNSTASAVASTTASAVPEAATSSSNASFRQYLPSLARTSTAALPSITLDLHNKQVDKPNGGYDAFQPTPAASSEYEVPTLSLASIAVPANVTGTPSANGDEEECKAPVYVTVTPTVFVTVGAVANATTPIVSATVY